MQLPILARAKAGHFAAPLPCLMKCLGEVQQLPYSSGPLKFGGQPVHRHMVPGTFPCRGFVNCGKLGCHSHLLSGVLSEARLELGTFVSGGLVGLGHPLLFGLLTRAISLSLPNIRRGCWLRRFGSPTVASTKAWLLANLVAALMRSPTTLPGSCCTARPSWTISRGHAWQHLSHTRFGHETGSTKQAWLQTLFAPIVAEQKTQCGTGLLCAQPLATLEVS